MEIRSEVVIEFKVDGNLFRFSCPQAAPIGAIYDCGFKIMQKALELAQDAANKAERPAQPEVSQVSEPVAQTSPISNADPVSLHPTGCTNSHCEGS